MIKTTERGWPGHFPGARDCQFRRNTLLRDTNTDRKIVISTVGAYMPSHKRDKYSVVRFEEIGPYCHYETMAFRSKDGDEYDNIDVSREAPIGTRTAVWVDPGWVDPGQPNKLWDRIANDMHENAVEWGVENFNYMWEHSESWRKGDEE